MFLYIPGRSVSKDLEVWLEGYIKNKQDEYRLKGRKVEKMPPAAKNYASLLTLLRDFEAFSNQTLSKRDISNDFIRDFIDYCLDERELNNSTINKRIDALFFFLKSFYPKPPDIQQPKHLETLKKKVIRLDLAELKQLQDLVIDDPIMDRTRDHFLFLCYTGLRFGDFVKLDRTFYDEVNNELVLTTNKTSRNCRIHLNPVALAIAEKYNFRFDACCNQDLNHYIKILLEKYHLFETPEIVEYCSRGRRTKECLKRELISCHTGRRTYISILAENGMSAYEIMSATGHTRQETVMFYIDLFGKERQNRFKALDSLFL